MRLKSVVKRGAIASLLVLPAVAGLAMPANASRTSHFSFAVVSSSAAPIPNSNITGASAAVANYHPAALNNLLDNWDNVPADCGKPGSISFTINNETTVPEQVTLGGANFGPALPPEAGLNVCANEGADGATAVFSLAGHHAAKLTAKFAP